MKTKTTNYNELPDTIYHYCDVETFMNIVKSKSIWMSHHSSMNDYSESSWFYNLLIEKANEIVSKDKSKLELLKKFIEHFFINIKDYFLACFSENGDSLSQWRAYADDGKGVSIGFSTQAFNIPHSIPSLNAIQPNIGIFRVSYNEEEQNHLAEDIISKVISSNDFVNIGGIDTYCLAVKNPAFAEEQEIRLAQIVMMNSIMNPEVVGLRIRNVASLFEYRKSKYGNITPYKPMSFNNDISTVIKEIVLGSKCGITQENLQWFLNKQVSIPMEWNIRNSQATYR